MIKWIKLKCKILSLQYALQYGRLEKAREAAAHVLGDLGDTRAVGPLIKALKDHSPLVRAAAAEALGKLGDPRAVEPLIENFEYHYMSGYLCPGVVEALGSIGDARAVEPLIRALKKERGGRGLIAEELGKLGDKRAVEPLIRVLRDGDTGARCAAAEALGNLGDAGAVEPLIQTFACLEPPNIILSEGESNLLCAAAEALGKLGDSCAVEPLIQVLANSKKYDMQVAVAKALGNLGDKRAFEPLIQALGELHPNMLIPNYELLAAAAEALGNLGDKRAFDPLIKALGVREWRVNNAAAKALGKLGDPRAVESLIMALGNGNSASAEVLGKLGDTRAVEPLIMALGEALGTRNEAKRLSVAEALGNLGQPEWIKWIKGNDSDFDRLGNSGDKRAIEPLIEALYGNRSEETICSAASALGKLGDSRVIEVLIRLKMNYSPIVHSKICQAYEEALAKLRSRTSDQNNRIPKNRVEEQSGSVAVENAIKIRETILSKHTLTKCCELAPINPRKVDPDHLGLLRVVVYRLDGKPIVDAEVDAILMSFVTERAMTDPKYLPVMNAITDGTFFPYPRYGFTIDLSADSAQQRINKCEILATTEYAKHGIHFKTTGHGLTAENVPYRIYFFWTA